MHYVSETRFVTLSCYVPSLARRSIVVINCQHRTNSFKGLSSPARQVLNPQYSGSTSIKQVKDDFQMRYHDYSTMLDAEVQT